MGGGRWSAQDWKSYSARNILNKSAATGAGGIYSARTMAQHLDPNGVIRESRDSADNPNSTPIMVGLDVTGSMSRVLEAMARNGLPTLATEIYERQPVSDPHILFMGIGDAHCDSFPLQATQFEADIRIAEQLTALYLEQGGGGNGEEGYALAWYFADRHTSIDSMEKRGKKGYLFTVGDDGPTSVITKEQADRVFGDTIAEDLDCEQLLKQVSRKYEVFHLCLEEGGSSSPQVTSSWKELLGERAIPLMDHTKMGEVIVSLLQVLGGADKRKVAASWDASTSLVVSKAISDITVAGGGSDSDSGSGGLITF
ncbi:hypothetical protein M6D81_12935 [Paenibacillus sp. J5C_2022]|uniref:hypothetical protein n=1 Tax=Paenibacillus sp. J5C2022 TaxID=2977129 RepID=UPI0021D1FFE4|nr:hypothetical protein [Paenibacillus sp. J5C2022]MCU6709604.1 hypothetical protein [Paenibacillus sp. J5C2022]